MVKHHLIGNRAAHTYMALIAILILSSIAHGGGLLFVDDDAPPGADGKSWDTAYRFLADALVAAGKGQVGEIRVAQGVYKPGRDKANPNGSGDREATFQLINDLALIGGYAGIGAKDPNARDIELFETILSGDLFGNDGPDFKNNDENSFNVVRGDAIDETAVLDGFTITAGNADGNDGQRRGGGMYNTTSARPTVANCTFSGNSAFLGGGGMFNRDNSSPTVANCTFSGNSAFLGGGGMYNLDHSSPLVTGCAFIENTTDFTGGAGMFNNDGSSPMVIDCTFKGNVPGDLGSDGSPLGNATNPWGGGMRNNANSSPRVIRCTFVANVAALGGGMFNLGDSNPTVTDCTFRDNSAGGGGGMTNWNNSNPTVTNCTFSTNSADGGGGMSNSQSSPTLDSCTFSGNSAEDGGGMSNNDSSPTLANCTFSENSAEYGGGMENSQSNPTLNNCTFSGNSAEDGGGMYNRDSSPAVTDCTFNGNSVDVSGGGMANWSDSRPSLTNCTFTENSADFGGGGMYNNDDSSPTVTNCTFVANSGFAFGGGGMYNDANSSPTVIDCTFSGNVAGSGASKSNSSSPTVTDRAPIGNAATSNGGGMHNHDTSRPTVISCTFIANSALRGGGMWNDGHSMPLLANCTFSDNSADQGGGMCSLGSSSPTVANCTFSGNWAYDGGGIYTFNGSEPTLANCIVWGNDNGQIDGATITVSYSCVEGGFEGTGNIDVDPMFVAPGTGDYRLSAGSPCVDAANNWGLPVDVNDYDEDGVLCELFPVDLDGNPRFNADEADFDPGCGVPVVVDMGAYEYQFDPADQVTFADLNGDGDVGATDLLGLLVNWGPCAKGCCLADLDIDGNVGASDLLALLVNWGPCPYESGSSTSPVDRSFAPDDRSTITSRRDRTGKLPKSRKIFRKTAYLQVRAGAHLPRRLATQRLSRRRSTPPSTYRR